MNSKTTLSLLILLCVGLCSSAQMSGTYTVGHPGSVPIPDYTSIQAAADALEANGVDGAVVIEIYDGTYNENLSLYNVSGVSSSNKIKFVSQGYDKSLVTLSSDVAILDMAHIDCDYVTFQHITFDCYIATSHSAWVVNLGFDTHGDSFKFLDNEIGCRNCDSISLSSMLVHAYGDRALIKRNIINGATTKNCVGLDGLNCEVSENEFADGSTGLNLGFKARTIKIKDNSFTGFVKSIYSNKSGDIRIIRNKFVQDSMKILSYSPNPYRSPIHLHILDSVGYNSVTIRNNMISLLNHAETAAIRINLMDLNGDSTSTELEGLIQHNSIMIRQTEDTGYGIRIEADSGPGLKVESNSIQLVGPYLTGLEYYNPPGSAWPISDYNNVHRSGGSGTSWYGVRKYLPIIRAQTGMEMNSIAGLPHYVSDYDLHIYDNSANINEAYINLSVSMDYDKDPRQYWDNEYDIGADEYDILGFKNTNPIDMTESNVAKLPLRLFPNPAQDYLSIALDDKETHAYELYSLDGKLVQQGSLRSDYPISIQSLEKGIYLIHLVNSDYQTTPFQVLR